MKWPEDADNKVFIASFGSDTMEEIIDIIRIKWPNAEMCDIRISVESHQIHGKFYSSDPSDFGNFLVLEKFK